MTFTQMLAVGAIGGIAGVLSLALTVVLAILSLDFADWTRDRLHDTATALRTRAAFRATRHDINALPTAHPTREPR
ncbi:hypothetical protein [Streptomyces sp. NPDC048386]|uniref:hypothetical protein n=1 Tax=Streptomyces sp. NPDC048386 TaxID=3365541 RepID=UPI00371135A2